MTNEQKLIALAKLDGWKFCDIVTTNLPSHKGEVSWDVYEKDGKRASFFTNTMPKYFTNGDEIRRLIGKQSYTVGARIIRLLNPDVEWDDFGLTFRITIQGTINIMLATPEQLAEALLRATGN